MVYIFSNQRSRFWYILVGLGMEKVGIFYVHLEYIGIFYGYLEYFMAI
jgi:hypothetical protein